MASQLSYEQNCIMHTCVTDILEFDRQSRIEMRAYNYS